MKKTSLIIFGIGAVVLLFAIWLYLLIYGTPTKVTEYFANFNSFNSNTVASSTPTPEPAPVTVDVKKDALRQLTTRPVVGFAEFKNNSNGTTTRFIRYAEAGTGNIYQINLESGEEIRLSNITVPNAESAAFSPDGMYIAVRSGYTNTSKVILLTLTGSSSADSVVLNPQIVDYTFSPENELLYTELTSDGTTGSVYTPATGATRVLFTIPFQAVTMVWSHNPAIPHYAYPKTSPELRGYLYAIKAGNIVRQPIDGLGLTAKANSEYIVKTEQTGNGAPVTTEYNFTTGKPNPIPLIFEPSKCTFTPTNSTIMYCGYELNTFSPEYPTDWYRGDVSFADNIWKINLKTQSANQLVSPLQNSGRTVDIINLNISDDGKMLYFTNKNDNTLWLYEI
jgi:WD40 repeat protein